MIVLSVVAITVVFTILFLCRPRAWLPVYAFLLPVAPQVSAGDLPICITNVAFVTGLFSLITYRLLHREFRVIRTPFFSITAVFLLSLLFSTLTAWLTWGSHYGQLSVLKFARMAEAFAVMFLAADMWTENDPNRLRRLLYFIFVGAFAGAALGLISIVHTDMFYSLYNAERYGYRIWIPGLALWRAVGVFLEPNHLSSYMVLIIMLGVATWSETELKISKLLLAMTLAICTATLLLTFSRAGWLNLLVASTTYVLISRKYPVRRKLRVILAGAGLVILCGLVIGMIVPAMQVGLLSRILTTIDLASSGDWNLAMSGRLSVWQQASQAFVQYPILGIGYKCLPELFIMGDNTFLTMLAEGGVVGMSIWAVWLISITVCLRRMARRHWLGEYLFAAWLGLIANMATADVMTYWRTVALFSALLGVAVIKSYRRNDHTPSILLTPGRI